MSKCDLQIKFDREDRTYAGGETVTGRVYIRINNSMKSNGVTLTHQWRTHGRGNVSGGTKETVELEDARSYSPGEELEFSFSLRSPTYPVTYHGTMLNVDHYVSVEVNVPWAFDPKAEEDYVLVPGEPPAHFVGSRNEIIALTPAAGQSSTPPNIILAILSMMFSLAFFLLIKGPSRFCKNVLAGRLGEVKLSTPHVVVAPGEQWTARIQFQPRKRFRINSIGVTLLGEESATSGSGTKTTTHTHKIWEQKLVVRSNDILTAGELVSEEFTFVLPTTAAFSLDLMDNTIQWRATVRIDMPLFPDWSQAQHIQIVPESFLRNLTDGPPMTSPDNTASFLGTPHTSLAPVCASESLESDEEEESSESATQKMLSDFLQLVATMNAAPRHGNARGHLVSNAADQIFEAAILIDRVTSSMGASVKYPGYEYGKTVTGTIDGTDQAIQVNTLESQNNGIDDLRRGDIWQTQLTLIDWDSLYNRINARQIDENAG
ncbi:MAG: hypothetical protein DWI22_15740 [Planctomycetota bacterium]|nr:hypothetical protein [Planctomycetales bacterium]RLT04775.1 MAG: hypothetical protein DWI22_15740 [Planctomycetota bacterium]